MEYESHDELILKKSLIPVLNNFVSKTAKFTIIENSDDGITSNISILGDDSIQGENHNFLIHITIENSGAFSKIKHTKMEVKTSTAATNKYALEAYIKNFYYEVLLSENNSSHPTYVVRIYSRIFNSHQIMGEYLINFKYKTLIKPAPSPSKQEPNTEHVIFFDVEIPAVNVEHARTLAYEHVYNLHAYLSVLLDVNFEFIDSDFRTFVLRTRRDEASAFSTQRYRTGYFDPELQLIVSDNLNHLRHIDDEDDVGSFLSGKISLSLVNDDGISSSGSLQVDATKKPSLEQVFRERGAVKSTKNNEKHWYSDEIRMSRHISNQEIKIPKDIRKYFLGIHRLGTEKGKSFLACARMYNLALKFHRQEPTAAAAYLVCSVEALSKNQGGSVKNEDGFSKFMERLNPIGYNKKLCDHYYSLRSSHFHAGEFHFLDSNPSLLTETDMFFVSKKDQFAEFYNTIRGSIVTWIREEVLPSA